jgi:hypothetical protein
MKTFIQLRDNVGYAWLRAESAPDHSVTPDHTTAVEVFTENPDEFLNKKYDEKTNTWSDAPLIVFAVLNDAGYTIEINRTYFEHNVTGPIITSEMLERMDILHTYKWDGSEWIAPFIEAEVVSETTSAEQKAIDDAIALENRKKLGLE